MSVNTNLQYGGITLKHENPYEKLMEGVGGFASGLRDFGSDVTNMGKAQGNRTKANKVRELWDKYNAHKGNVEALNELKANRDKELKALDTEGTEAALETESVVNAENSYKPTPDHDYYEPLEYTKGMSKDEVKKLQEKIGLTGNDVDGVWGPTSQEYLDLYNMEASNDYHNDKRNAGVGPTLDYEANPAPVFKSKYDDDITNLEDMVNGVDVWGLALEMKRNGDSTLHDELVRNQTRQDTKEREAANRKETEDAKALEEMKAANQAKRETNLKATKLENAIIAHNTKGYKDPDTYTLNGVAIEDTLAELEDEGYDTTRLWALYNAGKDKAAEVKSETDERNAAANAAAENAKAKTTKTLNTKYPKAKVGSVKSMIGDDGKWHDYEKAANGDWNEVKNG